MSLTHKRVDVSGEIYHQDVVLGHCAEKERKNSSSKNTTLFFRCIYTQKIRGRFSHFFFGAVLCFTSCSQVNNARALLKRKRERENGYLRKYVAYQPIKQFSSFFFLLVYLETKKTTKKPVFQSPQKRAIPFFFFFECGVF